MSFQTQKPQEHMLSVSNQIITIETNPMQASQTEKEGSYEVEEIIKHKTCQGKNSYLIKWVGYASKHNTWEPEDNLNEELVEDYHDQLSESSAEKNKSAPQKHPVK